jgi:hypothetical protein
LPGIPKINSKSKRIVYIPDSIEEEQISDDFKKLCLQDEITTKQLMLEAIQLLFKVHHWPPGNPQLTLVNYQQSKLASLGKCGIANCTYKAVAIGVNQLTKKEFRFCKKHFSTLPSRYDPKVWQFKDAKA